MPESAFNDAELWKRIAQDDCRAFVLLFEKHWPTLYKTALHYIKDKAAAEEIVHDLFLTLWNRRKQLVIQDFDKYLKAAARYQLYAYIKKNKPSRTNYSPPVSDERELRAWNTAPGKIEYRELENQLDRHLLQLPVRCREIFLLSRMHHFSNREIAEKLGISRRTVENQLTHALHSIRYNLKNIIVLLLLIYMQVQ